MVGPSVPLQFWSLSHNPAGSLIPLQYRPYLGFDVRFLPIRNHRHVLSIRCPSFLPPRPKTYFSPSPRSPRAKHQPLSITHYLST
ncbi:hypothetical protein FPOAC1_009373 [Fusarium poae]|uniref:hypothetical protein n=1 Tax=Fusarium poae TaxID=36050 RepID=UPI001CEBA8D4|nr:hypothetical protein FPOAC1_009373 [Fusarium poae]KAG8669970.1 hypothetical protein FPOAC1_009373 [Fusarium poae]